MYVIRVHTTDKTHLFTGNFLQALAEAKRLSLAAHSWVTLGNPTTGHSRSLRHREAKPPADTYYFE